jgi:hypothetical protein
MSGALALIVVDPEGGFDVVDARDGLGFAWEGRLGDAGAIAAYVNATYPPGTPAPARDSLAHEVRMWRIGGEWPGPLFDVDLAGMIPAGIDDRPALWKPGGGH